MTRFDQLKIEPTITGFIGKKIEVEEVLGKEIQVHKFAIGPSKFQNTNKGNGQRLTLQITHEEKMRVIFSGSVVLQNMILQVPPDKFPFTTTIQYRDKRLQFT